MIDKIIGIIVSLLLNTAPVTPITLQDFKAKKQIEHLYTKIEKEIVFLAVDKEDGTRSYGSAAVITKEGTLITAAHVVTMSTNIGVITANHKHVPVPPAPLAFPDIALKAMIIDIDEGRDLASLQLESLPTDIELKPVKFRETEKFTERVVGTKVAALGHPFKLKYSFSTGVVSQIRPSIVGNNLIIHDTIQTDTALNPGNSGCPVFDMRGRFLGIASFIVGARTYTGVSFLIPAHRVTEFLDNKPLSPPIYK